MDEATGQLHLSQALLQIGIDLGLPAQPLEHALQAAGQLCSGVRAGAGLGASPQNPEHYGGYQQSSYS